VDQFTLQQGGQTIVAKRVEPFAPDAAALAEYAGSYYSDELGTAYTIVVKDGKLSAEHQRNEDVRLTPTARDQFSGSAWFFSRVSFTRDKDRRVTGFRLTGGRVRNLRFDRQSRQ
jgi:hypothetical protein